MFGHSVSKCVRGAATAIAVSLSFLTAATAPAYAYLDPGVAGMVVQGIVAGVAAVSSILFVARSKLQSWWNRLLRRKASVDETARLGNDKKS
jgi:hypothetical protein